MVVTSPPSTPLQSQERVQLIKELEARYASSGVASARILYLRKKYAWFIVVRGARLVKRFLDITISSALLALLAPLMLLIAVAIKLQDGGEILYVSPRVGKWGAEFLFPKFRSMIPNADKAKAELHHQNDHDEHGTFKMRRDPRVTPIGRFIRRCSLDELPQLWCVLKGTMSLVGPRPPLPEEVASYTLMDRRRLDVKPGITCIWQVSGRSNLTFSKQVRLDVEYIESQSVWLDIKLLLQTIPAVILGRGAY
jgi:lipopolysaccharide/colanic/teichoic acid biosynthesis glycosyltransferase